MNRNIELGVLLFVFLVLTFASYMSIPESDLMKQAFAAIVGFVTGGGIGYAIAKRTDQQQ